MVDGTMGQTAQAHLQEARMSYSRDGNYRYVITASQKYIHYAYVLLNTEDIGC
jgi:hypothetical protein